MANNKCKNHKCSVPYNEYSNGESKTFANPSMKLLSVFIIDCTYLLPMADKKHTGGARTMRGRNTLLNLFCNISFDPLR